MAEVQRHRIGDYVYVLDEDYAAEKERADRAQANEQRANELWALAAEERGEQFARAEKAEAALATERERVLEELGLEGWISHHAEEESLHLSQGGDSVALQHRAVKEAFMDVRRLLATLNPSETKGGDAVEPDGKGAASPDRGDVAEGASASSGAPSSASILALKQRLFSDEAKQAGGKPIRSALLGNEVLSDDEIAGQVLAAAWNVATGHEFPDIELEHPDQSSPSSTSELRCRDCGALFGFSHTPDCPVPSIPGGLVGEPDCDQPPEPQRGGSGEAVKNLIGRAWDVSVALEGHGIEPDLRKQLDDAIQRVREGEDASRCAMCGGFAARGPFGPERIHLCSDCVAYVQEPEDCPNRKAGEGEDCERGEGFVWSLLGDEEKAELLAARRGDPEFKDRLRRSIAENQDLLGRLEPGTEKQPDPELEETEEEIDTRVRLEEGFEVRLQEAEAALREIRDTPITGSELEWVDWAKEVAAVVLPAPPPRSNAVFEGALTFPGTHELPEFGELPSAQPDPEEGQEPEGDWPARFYARFSKHPDQPWPVTGGDEVVASTLEFYEGQDDVEVARYLPAPSASPVDREPDPTGGLPPELADALSMPGIIIGRDREIRLKDGKTLAEHLEEWRDAPSNTVTAVPRRSPVDRGSEDLRTALGWALGWIEHCHEVPVETEEADDHARFTAAKGLLNEYTPEQEEQLRDWEQKEDNDERRNAEREMEGGR